MPIDAAISATWIFMTFPTATALDGVPAPGCKRRGNYYRMYWGICLPSCPRLLQVVLFQLTNYQARVAAHFISDRLRLRPTIALTPQPAQ